MNTFVGASLQLPTTTQFHFKQKSHVHVQIFFS